MQNPLKIAFLPALAPSASVDPASILAPATPPKGRDILVRQVLDKRHADGLFSYVSIVRDGGGRTLLRVKHSNGTKGDRNIQFVVSCNETGRTGKSHQYLGHSRYGAVVRTQYFTLDCPSNNIALKFVATEVWNSVGERASCEGTVNAA